jgi:hypothetical protein
MSEIEVRLHVKTNHPTLGPLVDAYKAHEPGSIAHVAAIAAFFTEYLIVKREEAAYRSGKARGNDEGAAPYLDGPWWKRAWTAARS